VHACMTFYLCLSAFICGLYSSSLCVLCELCGLKKNVHNLPLRGLRLVSMLIFGQPSPRGVSLASQFTFISLPSKKRSINPQDSGFRRTLGRACPERHGCLESKKMPLKIAAYILTKAGNRAQNKAGVLLLSLLPVFVSAQL